MRDKEMNFMGDLVAVLSQLSSRLERLRKEGLKELPTRTIFIDPILEALGWDVRDPDEVQMEYPTVDGKSVDYALKLNRKPVLLVEAKALNDTLKDVKDVTQTTGYAANDGIVWCILTNGVRWRVYRSMEQCAAPDKLMYEVSYDPLDLEGSSLDQIAEQFKRFSREGMAKGTLDDWGKLIFTDGKVRKALQSLVSESPAKLSKLVRKTIADPSLTTGAVQESLVRVLQPLLASSPGSPLAPAPSSQSKRHHASVKSWKTRRSKRDSGYSEDWHTKDKPKEVVELYRQLDQFCLALRPGGIEKQHLKMYIAWREGKRAFCSAHIGRGGLRVWLKLKYQHLSNPPSFARDVAAVGHWGVGDVELAITNAHQLSEAEPLIRRAFEEV
jgi:predicted transport protein